MLTECRCGCTEIDWGTGYTVEGSTVKRYIYAKCNGCGEEKRKAIHDDTYYSMTVSLAAKQAADLWGRKE